MTLFEAAMVLDQEWGLAGVEPSDENFIDACQLLIDSGQAWRLQGHVGRTCARMIDAGHCTPAEESA